MGLRANDPDVAACNRVREMLCGTAAWSSPPWIVVLGEDVCVGIDGAGSYGCGRTRPTRPGLCSCRRHSRSASDAPSRRFPLRSCKRVLQAAKSS